jgi:GH24 family phage-related lysozyme (muramidase)
MLALPATPPKSGTELKWTEVAGDFEQWEGKVAHMYLDTKGLVTVGVGKMLPNVKAAQALGFVKQIDGRAASAEEIATDFKEVSKQAKGKLASSYKRYTKLMLPDEIIDALLKKVVTGFEADLAKNFAHYQTYPAPAKRALLDMAYNLGLDGLLDFKKLKKAAECGTWRTAAAQCHRAGPSQERNDWTREMFLQAAAEAVKK